METHKLAHFNSSNKALLTIPLLHQLVDTLKEVHNCNIIHKDIKLSNILVYDNQVNYMYSFRITLLDIT